LSNMGPLDVIGIRNGVLNNKDEPHCSFRGDTQCL
jgi:hypothetical protein